MIDHERALELAATAFDFQLSPADDEALTAHLDVLRVVPRDRRRLCAPTLSRWSALSARTLLRTSAGGSSMPWLRTPRPCKRRSRTSAAPKRPVLLRFPARLRHPAALVAAAAVIVAVVGRNARVAGRSLTGWHRGHQPLEPAAGSADPGARQLGRSGGSRADEPARSSQPRIS